jgi:arylsulfatase A-like enzyme
MYAEEVRYADRWVGELLTGLKALGTYDDSLIVITADHGEELFDHGGLDHGHSMHEEVVSVPLLVKWPGGVTGDKLVTQTVPLMAVAGTLLQLARAPGLNEGDQALPTRDQGSVSEVYSEGIMYGTEHTALTTDDYRIIYHPYDASRQDWFEVYDRRRDRRERHNLADTEAAWGLRSRLKQLTEAAERAAVQAGGGPGARRFPLPDGMKRRMKSLGYVGN